MNVVPLSVTIVIPGAWNPAILTPEWITHELFNVPENETVDVSLEIPVGIASAGPKIGYQGFLFGTGQDKLIITIADPTEANLQQAEDMCVSLLAKLQYTPVSAFGLNIILQESSPSPVDLDVFKNFPPVPEDFQSHDLSSRGLRWSVKLDNCTLNINVDYADVLQIRYNFHFTASSAADAAEKMKGVVVSSLLGLIPAVGSQ